MTRIEISIAQASNLSVLIGEEFVKIERREGKPARCYAVTDDVRMLAGRVRSAAEIEANRPPEPSATLQAKQNTRIRSLRALQRKLEQAAKATGGAP